jgi:kynurenine formamidase
MEVWTRHHGQVVSAYDRVSIECHGTDITHLDALNHFGLESTFYRTDGDDPADGVDVATLTRTPVVTRAVYLDLVAEIAGDHVEVGAAIGADQLRAALGRSGATLRPGDALLLHMGREEFERSGGRMAPIAESPDGRPGVSEDGARWLAGQSLSLLAWDLLDAHPHRELALSVHALIWAKGLVLIDNCSFVTLRAAIEGKSERTGMLVAAPLPVPGATGGAVNPVVIV